MPKRFSKAAQMPLIGHSVCMYSESSTEVRGILASCLSLPTGSGISRVFPAEGRWRSKEKGLNAMEFFFGVGGFGQLPALKAQRPLFEARRTREGGEKYLVVSMPSVGDCQSNSTHVWGHIWELAGGPGPNCGDLPIPSTPISPVRRRCSF